MVADALVVLSEEGVVVVLVLGWVVVRFLVVVAVAAAAGVADGAASLEEEGWDFLDWTTACVCSISSFFAFAIVVVDFVAVFFFVLADSLEDGGWAFFLDLESWCICTCVTVEFVLHLYLRCV